MIAFNINLGDTIYSDSQLSGSKPALTVPAKWHCLPDDGYASNLVGEIRLQALEGSPIGTGIREAVTGPVATNTDSKEIDSAIGAKGTAR